MAQETKEPQYGTCVELARKQGFSRFGVMSNEVWHEDPRRITFLLSRYKFVAKMFSGMEKVVEIGCADAFGSRLVQQEVKNFTAVDFDPLFVEDAKARMQAPWTHDIFTHDMLQGPIPGGFDAAFALDVFEHIQPKDEHPFLENIGASLRGPGAVIIGSPSLESQAYASRISKAGHVNCKTAEDLRATLKSHFHHVFIFSMNDEIVHTGFSKMAHYHLAVCSARRSE